MPSSGSSGSSGTSGLPTFGGGGPVFKPHSDFETGNLSWPYAVMDAEGNQVPLGGPDGYASILSADGWISTSLLAPANQQFLTLGDSQTDAYLPNSTIVEPGNNVTLTTVTTAGIRSLYIAAPGETVTIAAGAEVADVRRLTLQVQDPKGTDRSGYWVIFFWISTSSAGAPAGTQTVALASGVILQTITANQAYHLLTDNTGEILIDVTIAGAATLYFHALAIREITPASAAWT